MSDLKQALEAHITKDFPAKGEHDDPERYNTLMKYEIRWELLGVLELLWPVIAAADSVRARLIPPTREESTRRVAALDSALAELKERVCRKN